MLVLVLVSVVVGSTSGQGYLRDTPEVEAARNAFVREYNRLALLAAQAPDTEGFSSLPQHGVKLPASHQTPSINTYAYTSNFGGSNPAPASFQAGHLAGHLAGHYVPAVQSAPWPRWTGPLADTVPAGLDGQVKDTPTVAAARAAHFAALQKAGYANGHSSAYITGHMGGHMAGHLTGQVFGHHTSVHQPATHRFAPAAAQRWTGPVADTVPAGVDGQVKDTPGVAAVKTAHLQAVAAALGYRF